MERDPVRIVVVHVENLNLSRRWVENETKHKKRGGSEVLIFPICSDVIHFTKLDVVVTIV